jgi:hypothetical protein
LLEEGAPSLLNESAVYLALHDACLEHSDEQGAREAIRKGLAPVVRRLQGLVGTPYARLYITELSHNARLVAAAEDEGLMLDSVHRILDGGRS